jgi:heme oxygenase
MTVVAPTGLDLPLSAAMREGSRREHQRAEDSPFMSELAAGRVDATGYTAYLLRLRRVYAALESTARGHASDPLVAAVHDPALERVAALDADLEHWAPDGPRHVSSPAAEGYERRVLGSPARPGRFVAHHYTRYLGDLSGGQVIGRVLRREFRLDGRGTAFYDFPGVPKPKPYKDAYRARLDALDVGPADKQDIVEEVRLAFRLNQALFDELALETAGRRR